MRFFIIFICLFIAGCPFEKTEYIDKPKRIDTNFEGGGGLERVKSTDSIPFEIDTETDTNDDTDTI